MATAKAISVEAFWEALAMLYLHISRAADAAARGDRRALSELSRACSNAATYCLERAGVTVDDEAA